MTNRRILDRAHGGAIVGLGAQHVAFTVALDDAGGVVVRLAEPVTRLAAVADAVRLAAQCPVLVIDGSGREVTL